MGLFKDERSSQLFEAFQRRFTILARFFWANWISSTGSMLVIVTTILILIFLAFHIYSASLDRPTNPYLDLVGFFILPGLFLFGWLVIGLGTIVSRVQKRRLLPDKVVLEVDAQVLRRRATVFGLSTFAGLVILGAFSYEGFHYTDSVDFCADVCHTVMRPESVAYERSPHANVTCVSCHIGPGASWFVRSKLSGLRQVFAVLGDTYERPIPAPVHDLRPARETCEECHWPAKFHGSKLVIKEHFATDEENTRNYSALVMKVGGLPHPDGQAHGIHWHVDPRNQVRYRAVDEKREQIVEVVQSTPDGEIRYLHEDADPDDTSGEWRVMDCIDCHNRPTHVFEIPETAVDEMLAAGQIPADIPFIKKEAVRVLRELEPGENTPEMVSQRLESIYRDAHPEAVPQLRESLPKISGILAEILRRNVFPLMKVTWGTYTNHIGHFDAEGEMTETGCFRCHDEMHVSDDGSVISQDCETCHAILAEQEEDLQGLPDFVIDFLSKP